MNTKTVSQTAVVSVTIVSLLLSGCATLWRPYIEPARTKPTTFDSVLNDAQALAVSYRDAANDDAGWSRITGTVLIPVAAATGFIAATSQSRASKDAVLAATAAGATGVGLTTWLTNKGRQQVFLSGARAMQCAIGSVEHLWLSEAEQALLNAETGAPITPPARPTLESQLAVLNAIILALRGSGQADLIALANELGNLETQARALLVSARSLGATRVAATARLSSSIATIANKVDESLLRLQPEIGSLDSTLTQLWKKGTVDQPGTTTASANGAATQALDATGRVGAARMGQFAASAARGGVAGLPELVSDIATKTRQLAFVADTNRFKGADGPPVDCMSGIFVPLIKVLPSTDIALVTGTTEYTFVVTGGLPPYFVQKLSVDPKIEIEAKANPGISTVVVKLNGYTSGAKSITHTFVLFDRSGDSSAIVLKLVDTAPK